MKIMLAIVLAAGVVIVTPSFVRADDGSVSTRHSDVDLKAPNGARRFFTQLELGGGGGG